MLGKNLVESSVNLVGEPLRRAAYDVRVLAARSIGYCAALSLVGKPEDMPVNNAEEQVAEY